MSQQLRLSTISIRDVHFPNGNHAHAVFLPPGLSPQASLPGLNIPAFHGYIMLTGGASLLTQTLYPHLVGLFTYGIAQMAAINNMLIIDGGTQAGVMELMGQGIAEQHHLSPLLGIAPTGCVSYPGQATLEGNGEVTPLDPNHSHFLLVETKQWGGETAAMYEIASFFSHHHDSVAIMVNGGSITIKEVLYNVRQKRPIIVLEGSGRAADEIAHLWRQRTLLLSDPDLVEIIRDGDIHLFPVTGLPSDLVRLIETLLNA